MCQLDERIYISAHGNRAKFEDSFPCDKAQPGKLCSKVKKKTTEYYPRNGIVPRRDGTPSPVNPATPTGTGSYLVQQRRPSLTKREESVKREIVIEFGSKRDKGKKYSSNSTKHSSISAGATYDDVAAESQDEDASHTIRTGLPELSLPSSGYECSDVDSTTPNVAHGYHHRHTSSVSSYMGSSKTPSLYVTPDPYYDLLASTRSKRFTPVSHWPTNAGASSSIDTDFQSDSGYSSFMARTTSSVESSWSTPDESAPVTKTLKGDGQCPSPDNTCYWTNEYVDPQVHDRRTSSEVKQVRSVDPTQKIRRLTRYHMEPKGPQASSRRQTTGHENETTHDCTDPNCVTCGPNVRVQRKWRSSVSSRDSSSAVSAQSGHWIETARPRFRAPLTFSPPESYMYSFMDSNPFLVAQPPLPFPSEQNPHGYPGPIMPPPPLSKNNRGPTGRPLRPPTPDPSPRNDLSRELSLARESHPVSLSNERRRRSSFRRVPVIVQSKLREDAETSRLDEAVENNRYPNSIRNDSAWSPRVVHPNDSAKHDAELRGVFMEREHELLQLEEERGIEARSSLREEESDKLRKEERMRLREEERNQDGSKQSAVVIVDRMPQKEPRLGSANDETISPLPSKNNKLGKESMMRPGPDDSSAMNPKPEILPEPEVLFMRESGIYIHVQSSKQVPDAVKPLAIRPSPDTTHKDASDHLERPGSMQERTSVDKPNEQQPMKDITKQLILLPRLDATNAPPVRLSTSLDTRSNAIESNDSISGAIEEENGSASSGNSADESDETIEDCEVHIDDALNSAMNVVKNLLVRELLQTTLPDAMDASGGTNASSSGSGGSSTSQSLASSSVNSQTPPKGKRSRGGGRDPSDGDGDNSDNDDDRPKKKGGQDFPDCFPRRRLKCPFYQQHPEKYNKAACRGLGFVEMGKLKDHIKRVHTQPLRCSRCWLEMKSDEAYSEHLQQESICEKASEPLEDRIRPQLLKRLDFKKAPYSNARNVEEKWRILFKVLFPNNGTIPSPCKFDLSVRYSSVSLVSLTTIDEQQGISPQLERALYEALEEELTRELALVIEPIRARIKGCIPAIIDRCRAKLQSSTPSSDDEAVFTSLSTSSVTSNGKSGCVSTNRQDSPQRGFAKSPCSENPFGPPLNPDTLADGARASAVQPPASSANYFKTIDPQDIFAEGSGTDFSIQPANQHGPSHFSHKGGLSIMPELEKGLGSMNQMSYAYQPETHTLAALSDSAQMFSNESMMLEPYQLTKSSTQQEFLSLPSHTQPNWPGEEASWDKGNATHAESAEQSFQQTENSQDWEYFMRDFDLNGSRF
jgi:hypothetical protein